jgi:trans-2,3-dihydro-3-hydroxyanthranilate isomerase
MRAMIAWWDLDGSAQTIDTLRDYLRDEGVHPWRSVSGLCLKFWIADRERNRWGAVMLWESADAVNQPLPPHRAAKLIGYPPAQRMWFDVEATTEGIHGLASLAGLGPALDKLEPTVRDQ